nr:hypothetical protein B0A51_02972 [Rachicladosporium sp. CCFEE 5018]
MRPPLIAVVGGINEDIVFRMPRAPGPGESCLADSMVKHPGGKGANIAMAACRARDGLPGRDLASPVQPQLDTMDIFLNGAVGADERGARLLEHLKRGGVNVSHVHVMGGEATATGMVMLETAINDSRSFAYHGAMFSWRMPDSRTVSCLASGDMPDIVVANLTAPQDEVAKVFAAAARERAAMLFNPSPIQEIDGAMSTNLTHLILNQSEAAALRQLDTGLLKDQTDWFETTAFFLRLGVSNVVLTLAAEGAYYATVGGTPSLVLAFVGSIKHEFFYLHHYFAAA